MLCPNLCKNFKAGDICVLLSLYIYLADTIAPENLRNSANLVSPQIIIHKNFHDFGFDVGRPISTLPPKCIALFWKTLDLQNMHQFLPTSEPIRLHQNTNSSYCCLYMYKFNSVIRHHFHQEWHLYFKAWCICATWHFPNDMPSHQFYF